jgi:leader peptidase (prepilin peptidase)/N-methyltransferase
MAPFVGSFIGVLITRLPVGARVVLARSSCPSCDHALGLRDLVPLLSWAFLRGRCRHCGAAIGAFYPTIELAAVFIAAWAALVLPGALVFAGCLLGWTLLALGVIDWRHEILPDSLTLPLIAAGLGVAYWLDPATLRDHAIGAVAGFGAFFIIRLAYRRVRGREGLGMGDAKLLAAGGAWVSWPGLPGIVLWAAVAGLAVALIRACIGGRVTAADRIPFGPYLCGGIWLVWLYGPLILG